MSATTRYHAIRSRIEDGDLLLFRRPESPIARWGRGEVSHAATAAWRHGNQSTLLLAESREFAGGRLVTLSSQVRAYPGRIDLYRPTNGCPRGVRERAASIACNWAGKPYGWTNVAQATLMHTPILRFLYEGWTSQRLNPTDTRLSNWDEPKHCSQLVTWAYRRAQWEMAMQLVDWDPCPNLSDRFVEPTDLARSAAFRLIAKGLVI
jgi:hypothetical protein